jgi:hypothetical protein
MGKNKSFSAGKWLFAALFLLLSGCGAGNQAVFIEDHGHEYTARQLDELKAYMNSPESYAHKVKWKEITYPMADGYFGFVEPIGKDCSIHWMVNGRNKLVSYTIKGDGCDMSTKSDMDNANLKSIGRDDDGKSPWQGSRR